MKIAGYPVSNFLEYPDIKLAKYPVTSVSSASLRKGVGERGDRKKGR